jgi:hypothetical protein
MNSNVGGCSVSKLVKDFDTHLGFSITVAMRPRRQSMQWQIATRLLVAVLCLFGFAGSPSVAADDSPDPSARLAVKVKSIHVMGHSDSLVEEGELHYKLTVQRTAPGCGGVCHGPFFERTFSFSSGPFETREFDPPELVPAPPEPGLDLYPGTSLLIKWYGTESDPVFDDFVGSTEQTFDQAQRWGQGQRLEAKATNCDGCEGLSTECTYLACADGGFTVEYEIVPAPLPDLGVRLIQTGTWSEAGYDLVCVTVGNSTETPAGPYTLRLYVDGAIPLNGEIAEEGLGPSGAAEGRHQRCIEAAIEPGLRHLVAIVDEDRLVPESNELNNRMEKSATFDLRSSRGVILPIAPVTGTNQGPGPGDPSGPAALPAGSGPPAPEPTPIPAPGRRDQGAGSFDVGRYLGQGDKYDCDDFTSQADAQAVLRADPSDPNRLDTSKDGIACESNRAPKDMNKVPR